MMVEKIKSYKGHDASLYAIELSVDQKSFFAGGGDKVVSFWPLNDEHPSGVVNTGSTIYSLKLIPKDNVLLVGVSGGGMHVTDLINKKELRFIILHEVGIFDIQFSKKNNLIYTAGADGTINILSYPDFKLIFKRKFTKEKIRKIILSEDEKIIVFACGDGVIRIADAENGDMIREIIAHESSVNSLCFLSNTLLLSGGKDAHLRLWDLTTGQSLKSIPAHNYAIYAIQLSPDKKYIATASRDKTIKIWDADTLDILIRLNKEKSDGHTHSVNNLLWLDEERLLSVGDDRLIIEWKIS